MYALNVLLFHRPNSLVVESSTPRALAVGVAPIRKLWPVNPEQSILADDNDRCTSCTSLTRDRGQPSLKINSGPERVPLTAMYAKSNDTG